MFKFIKFELRGNCQLTFDWQFSAFSRLEEAVSRLTLALEELEENRREEEQFNSIGAKWKQVAKIIDRS